MTLPLFQVNSNRNMLKFQKRYRKLRFGKLDTIGSKFYEELNKVKCSPMGCSHGFFYQGNAKQPRTTLKNINFVLLQMSHAFIKITVYVLYIVPRTERHFFLGVVAAGGTYLKGALIPNFQPWEGH